ncbi:MAG: hypothetical protein K8S56_00650, partial [Candidatus Cloacimonetes bacterium]|nr:hypothetical protein [Candidatus Cloacimonadota bacterium]
MKILIANLTRMGDLIQMLGLVGGLKDRYPDSRIDILAISSFAGILRNFPHIDSVIELDDKALVDHLGDDIWSAYAEIDAKLNLINTANYDLFISPVPSVQMSILASRI